MIRTHTNNGKYNNAKKGYYFPLHPEKYASENKTIIYKSSLEQRFMLYLDKNPGVRWWKYEPYPLKYFDASTNKVRKYYIDFIVCVKGNPDKIFYCEVKSKKETLKPKNPKNIKENLLYLKNLSKWSAATRYCKEKGYDFKLITEDQLK